MAWTRASVRHQWWSVFLVMCALGASWSLATPLFASPDEPAHVVRAASLLQGDILGVEPHGKNQGDGGLDVRLPAIYHSASKVSCYAFKAEVPANCAAFTGSSTQDVTVETSAGRHPPWWYLFVGLPTLFFTSGVGVRLMRLVNVALTAAFMASAIVSLLRTRQSRLGAIGIAVVSTPMVLFLAGVVNPSAVEIAAAISFWVGGYVLVCEAPMGIDHRLVVRVSLAAAALALTRPLGPLWLGIIAITIVAIGGRSVGRTLRDSRPVRVGVATALFCCVAQGAWVVSVGTLDASNSNVPGVPGSLAHLASRSIGRGTIYFDELIGIFGWRDTAPPTAVWLSWTVVIGGIVALAVVTARRSALLAMFAVAFLSWFLPIFFEVRSAHAAGYFWQGRYTLPLAAGVPILAALEYSRRSRPPVPGVKRLLWCVALALGAAQVLAFGQAIRRYAVGAHGAIDFLFSKTPWSPPVPALVLVLGFTFALILWYGLLFHPGLGDETDDPPLEHEPDDEPEARSAFSVGAPPLVGSDSSE